MKRTWTITLLSDKTNWMTRWTPSLAAALRSQGHQVRLAHRVSELRKADIAFILGCSQIVPPAALALHRNNLVVHASALPKGRGWSPWSWQVLAGARTVPVSLFEAALSVDSGPIYLQENLRLRGDELIDELRAMIAKSAVRMALQFVRQYPGILRRARRQRGRATYYPRRRPVDSRLNIDKSLREQFNLLRIVDNTAFPAYFRHRGADYILRIEKRTPA